MSFVARTFDPVRGRTMDVRLPLARGGPALRLSLAPLPGASAVQVLLDDGTSRVRAEANLGSDAKARIDFDVAWLETGALRIEARYPLTYLPGDSIHEPASPIRGRDGSAPLDLLFVVDATCQLFSPETMGLTRRLAAPDAAGLWPSLIKVARGLSARHADFRCGFLCFSDHQLSSRAAAPDLLADDLFQPMNGPLLAYRNVEDLAAALRMVKAASGGDWVDALADALSHARQHGSWRPDARKLLILAGDSPGHSVLNPATAGGDIHSRVNSVEGEADHLHEYGVEVAAIHAGPSSSSQGYFADATKRIEHVRAQYQRLASLRDWCWDSTGFEEQAIATLVQPPAWIARGAAYGTDAVVGELGT